MRLAKLALILTSLTVGIATFVWAMSSSAAPQNLNVGSVTVPLSIPEGMVLKEVKEDETPALLSFFMESDYVVIVTADGPTAVPKKNRKPLSSNGGDLSEWVAGMLYTLPIERVLFSRQAFESQKELSEIALSKVQVLSKAGTIDDQLTKGQRYLLFLKEIPKNDKLLTLLDTDERRTYFRTYNGSQSIFPEGPDPMHGSNTKGKIDLSSGKYAMLERDIEAFAEAIATGDKNLRIQKLQRLTEVNNQTLRSNAKFALESLSN